jgi:hypothetical protein
VGVATVSAAGDGAGVNVADADGDGTGVGEEVRVGIGVGVETAVCVAVAPAMSDGSSKAESPATATAHAATSRIIKQPPATRATVFLDIMYSILPHVGVTRKWRWPPEPGRAEKSRLVKFRAVFLCARSLGGAPPGHVDRGGK